MNVNNSIIDDFLKILIRLKCFIIIKLIGVDKIHFEINDANNSTLNFLIKLLLKMYEHFSIYKLKFIITRNLLFFV